MGVFRFLRSRYRIFVSDIDRKSVLHFLTANEIPFHDLCKVEGGIVFYLYPVYFRRYKRLRGGALFEGETGAAEGLLALFCRYRRRLALPIGALLALFLLIFSSLFVWDIRITGTERLTSRHILEGLEQNGVRLGAYIPTLDTERIEGEMLLYVDGLSWISLNIRGTVVNVEVRERWESGAPSEACAPSNLVAAEDGQVVRFEVTGGVAACRLGETVKKGQLLVSGIIDSPALGTRLVRARGEVFARVSRDISVYIPFETEEKVYTGRKISKKTLKIFSKSIKLFGKDSISGLTCDTIESERQLTLFGIKLPLFLGETVYSEYETVPRTLSEAEASLRAEAALAEKRRTLLRDGELLARDTRAVVTDSGITLFETTDLLCNIAREQTIQTD